MRYGKTALPLRCDSFSRSSPIFLGSISNHIGLLYITSIMCNRSITSRTRVRAWATYPLFVSSSLALQRCVLYEKANQTTTITAPSLTNPPTIHQPEHNQNPQTGILEEIPSKFHAPDLSAKYLLLPVLRVGLPT
jgi:hypothetical protein